MNVYLLAHTPNPDAVVAAAARLCYSNSSARDLLTDEGENLSEKLIADLFKSGHMSTFEHVSFTFGVDDLSRVASHQLVRHRLASYSQQSQRYVEMTEDVENAVNAVVIPPSIMKDLGAFWEFQDCVKFAQKTYSKLLEMGIPKEDARFVLPHGYCTRLVMTMNARELHHFFSLRLCRRAQWEIHELAREMLALCREKAPLLFAKAGPGCIFGSCTEAKSCGNPYKDMKDLLKPEQSL